MTADIKVRPNGSLKLTGPATLVLTDGTEVEIAEGQSVALCRCGHSGNKPYCDATHRRIGFVDPEPATDAAPGEAPKPTV